MPAEWEPHAATWLAWPHYHDDWPGKFEPIPWVFAEIVHNLVKHERVELIVNGSVAARQARKFLERADAWSENIRFHRWPTNRIWLRDSGCIFLKSGAGAWAREQLGAPEFHLPHGGHEFSRALEHLKREGRELTRAVKPQKQPGASLPEGSLALKFRFNAWAKYSNWRHDDKIGTLMAKAAIPTLAAKPAARTGHPHFHEIRPESLGTRIVLEGGSIDVNGAGAILTTEECLLSKEQQRNPHMARVHYEKAFADYLGASHTIWLGRGIFGDDTHGHVDDLTRFVSRSTVVTMVEHNSKDVNHGPLRANLRRLQAARDQDGRQLTVVELPMPQPVIFEGRRLPASYANFYIANKVVLAPVFNRSNDRIALETLAQLFPTREIVPIYSGDFIWGLGAMHCITQQQPA
jgi:agmatine deiminase